MSWFFIHIYVNFDIEFSESASKKTRANSLRFYDEDGYQNPDYGKIPPQLYCFMEKKRAFQNPEIGRREFMEIIEDTYMVSDRVFDVIKSSKINFERSDVEIVNGEKYGFNEKFHIVKFLDVFEDSLDVEASGIKYKYVDDKRYVASVDKFVFNSRIESDLFLPMDFRFFPNVICSQNFREKIESLGVTDVKFVCVDDCVAISPPGSDYPDDIDIIRRPRSVDFYREKNLRKRNKKKGAVLPSSPSQK